MIARPPSRRRLIGLGLRALGAVLVACGRSKPESGSPDTGPPLACDPPVPDPEQEGWVELPLSEHPALAEVGGQEAVSVPEALLEVVVAQPTAGCWIAVWRVCTHGACEVAWEAETREIVCPCHQSRFSEDGLVLEGPATEDLRAFPVARQGDSLWIWRPL